MMIEEELDEELDEEAVLEDSPASCSLGEYIKTLKELASVYLLAYFKNKQFHCGGPITKSMLLSERNLNIVLSTPFADGSNEIYSAFVYKPIPENHNQSEIPFQTKRFLDLLAEVSKFGIPIYFKAGIMLLHLQFCEGSKIKDKKLDVTHIIE